MIIVNYLKQEYFSQDLQVSQLNLSELPQKLIIAKNGMYVDPVVSNQNQNQNINEDLDNNGYDAMNKNVNDNFDHIQLKLHL